LSILISILGLAFNPSKRTGPFGIGLPAPMKSFQGKKFNFSIIYPQSWVLFETTEGSHLDSDVIATINVPGRSWPSVNIRMKHYSSNNDEVVADDGEKRIKEIPASTQSKLSTFKTASYSGLSRDYSIKFDSLLRTGIVVMCRDYYLIEDGSGYTLTYCSEQDNWFSVEPVFVEMMSSFKLER
jgi:hypothetical protein